MIQVQEFSETDLIPLSASTQFGMLVTTKNLTDWTRLGLKNKQTGVRHYLRWVQRGGKRFSTKKWYEEFVAAVNEHPAGK